MPPNQLVALQRCVVGKVFILNVSVMVPLLQQGMLCRCKSRMLLPGAICFPAAVCLCTLWAAALVTRLPHHFSLPFMQASAALPVGPQVAGASNLVW